MVELESAIQNGLQDIEGLPSSVKVYHYNGMDDFCRIIWLENDRLYHSSGASKTKEWASGASCEGRKEHLNTPPPKERTLCTFPHSRLLGDCYRQNVSVNRGDTKNTLDDNDYSHNEDKSEHLIFIIQPATFEKDFIESDPSVRLNTFFNPKTGILVVKMLSPAHEQAVGAFNQMLIQAIKPTGLYRKIQYWGSTTMLAIDGTRKEADSGWSLRRHPPGTPKRPTVVLEVANSEAYAKLRCDAQYWLDPDRQEANVAIGVSLDTKKHEIIIDQWHWSSEISRPTRKTHVTIRQTSNGTTYFDPDPPLPPQLVIPFHLLFQRPPEDHREREVVIETQELVEFATQVWDVQFEQDQ
ncbi:hypothetical protein PITC_079590 [Penicillium italicum]|uniref:Restriction endonuclease domain-containing protein n=1 Tax=Penicillium italicum TaxID=40296 RepID=A0A0A2KFM3_PENIT|nr:hypothetical protein PITC_079590 [Penicillium italicum]